ncbi:MAG TPA: glutamate--tRNA ligase, partial [Candidatus Omnitrophica bacterium]|nr:glutamate--tRNA ligase [Candidatus Omnitrophota bacterium]
AANLSALKDRLKQLGSFETPQVEQAARALIAQRGLGAKDLIHPTRVAVTGRAVSPPLFEVMSIVGQAKVIGRLEYAAAHLAG